MPTPNRFIHPDPITVAAAALLQTKLISEEAFVTNEAMVCKVQERNYGTIHYMRTPRMHHP
jgi:hypothetical protein